MAKHAALITATVLRLIQFPLTTDRASHLCLCLSVCSKRLPSKSLSKAERMRGPANMDFTAVILCGLPLLCKHGGDQQGLAAEPCSLVGLQKMPDPREWDWRAQRMNP